MNHPYTRLAVLIAALILISAAAVPLVSAQDTSERDENIISTSARGEVMATPDRAQVTVAVQTENADVRVAQQENAEIADRMLAAIHDAGIASQDTKTVSYTVYPIYDDSGPFRTKVRYYQVTSSIQVTLRDVTKTGEIIDIAVENGANKVNSINFYLSEESELAMRAEVIKKAVARTKIDADAVASAIGVTITGVKDVTVGQSYSPVLYETARYAGATDEKSLAAPTPIEPGEMEISAQVSVTYLFE